MCVEWQDSKLNADRLEVGVAFCDTLSHVRNLQKPTMLGNDRFRALQGVENLEKLRFNKPERSGFFVSAETLLATLVTLATLFRDFSSGKNFLHLC